MAVEAVASQFSTQWCSTLLLSSSTASGLRHHQQHRSMTSQPRPGPRRPTCPPESKRPVAGWGSVWSPVSAFEPKLLQLSSTQCCSSSTFDIARTKFRSKLEVQDRPTIKPQHIQTHSSAFFELTRHLLVPLFTPTSFSSLSDCHLVLSSFLPQIPSHCPVLSSGLLLLPLACLLLSAALRIPADIYSSISSEDAQDYCYQS